MITTTKNIVFGDDFNSIFNCNFDGSEGNAILEKKSLAKLIEIKESFYLCGIWRIRNATLIGLTFAGINFRGFRGFFTYKYNQIQLSQYLLLHDIVYPTCC